jgi:hypothetical protein
MAKVMTMTVRLNTFVALLAAAVTVTAGQVSGQSLAELAKREDARRKAIKVPARVITNENLPAVPVPAPAPDAGAQPPATDLAPAAPAADAQAASATPATPEGPVKDEKYWRQRMATARAVLARSRVLQDALQSRINALSTDFVSRDDPAQRAVIGLDRQRAVAELDRVKQETVEAQQAIANTQEEARKAGAPAGWVR